MSEKILNDDSVPEIKAYYLSQIAKMYLVQRKTMLKWIKPFEHLIGEKIGRIYRPEQVKIIFEKLELPLGEKIERTQRKSRAKRYGTAQSAGAYSKQIEISNPRF
jgi:hypothetical protein